MKLLESAKDLKTTCYIYFLIGNESSTYITNVAYYKFLDIHTIYIKHHWKVARFYRYVISAWIPILCIVSLVKSILEYNFVNINKN